MTDTGPAFYRAVNFLLEHREAIQEEVFWSAANLLNLTVDLIFFDRTSTCFEIDEPGLRISRHMVNPKTNVMILAKF